MTVKAALAAIRALGLAAQHTDGEFRVRVKGSPAGEGYYTNDASDAVATAAIMARLVFRAPAVTL